MKPAESLGTHCQAVGEHAEVVLCAAPDTARNPLPAPCSHSCLCPWNPMAGETPGREGRGGLIRAEERGLALCFGQEPPKFPQNSGNSGPPLRLSAQDAGPSGLCLLEDTGLRIYPRTMRPPSQDSQFPGLLLTAPQPPPPASRSPISETGTHLGNSQTRIPSPEAFSSWAALAPHGAL